MFKNVVFSWKECMCIPWDMPRPDNVHVNLCESAGNNCFYSKMKNDTYLGESCKCYPKCNSNHYSYVEKQVPIDVKSECDKSSKGFLYTIQKTSRIIPELTRVYEQLKLHQHFKQSSHSDALPFNVSGLSNIQLYRFWCELSFKKDIAIVKIQIEGQSHVKMRRSLKNTFGDKLGMLGGTLGLFTGFSFMAFVEIVYWFIITIKMMICSCEEEENKPDDEKNCPEDEK